MYNASVVESIIPAVLAQYPAANYNGGWVRTCVRARVSLVCAVFVDVCGGCSRTEPRM